MISNYIKASLRNIKRHLIYSLLNVFGLAFGIASCLVIGVIVKNELSYDDFNEKVDRTYRITLEGKDCNANVSLAVASAMRIDFPDLEHVTQVFRQDNGLIKVGNNKFQIKNYAYVDEDFFNVFNYEWILGNSNALKEPNSIVLTESIAKSYFGSSVNSLGKTINLDRNFNLRVTGVIKDLPGNTHLPFNFLVSYNTIKNKLGDALTNFWTIWAGSFSYIVIPKNTDIAKIQNRMNQFVTKNWGKEIAGVAKIRLQPVKEIPFDTRYINSIITPIPKETYLGLIIIAIFIFIIASINFINLTTALSVNRYKEVGIRKVLGANRFGIFQQFFTETTILVTSSLIIGITVFIISLPHVQNWLGLNLNIDLIYTPLNYLLVIVTFLIITLLAGFYPSFIQSRLKPVLALKKVPSVSSKGITIRKGLVTVQFILSQILIIGTVVVAKQMDYFKNKELGFNKEAVITFKIPDNSKLNLLQNKLKETTGIANLCYSSAAPPHLFNATSLTSKELGLNHDEVTEVKFVDENYLDMFEIPVIAGEKIRKIKNTDSTADLLVNELALSKLGIKDPTQAIGKHVSIFFGYIKGTIKGVVKDFQSESKHKERRPCVLIYEPRFFTMVSAKLNMNDANKTVDKISSIWARIFPDEVFNYEFLDEQIGKQYKQEEKIFSAFKLFAAIAIIIGCLGLYGLVTLSVFNRTKEIGIRKVLGATITNIINLITKDYVRLVLVAFVVAAPISYFIMHKWLENFAYKIDISADIFIISLLLSILIASFTTLQQSVKAAFVNPAKSLKTE